MSPKHVNPTSANRTARAPYNFVPLPEAVVPAPNDNYKHQDTYQGNTGYIDCELTTKTPLYIRSGIAPEEFGEVGDKAFHELTEAQKKKRAEFFHTTDPNRPIIPGSSLRGMARMLVEMATFGKMHFVGNEPLVFRAVGDQSSLGTYYRNRLMKEDKERHFTPLMKAGFLEKTGGRWAIRPAQEIGGTTFARIFRKEIPRDLPAWHDCKNARQLWVQLGKHEYQDVRGFIKIRYTMVTGTPSATEKSGFQKVILARSGDIPKKAREAVVFPPDLNAATISVPDEMVTRYRDQISQEQEKILGKAGALNEHQPVFYLIEKGQLIFLGHAMLFRLPYERAPRDFIPNALLNPKYPDFADAIFGRVPDDKTEGWAGRVFFSDAVCEKSGSEVWLSQEAIHPKILATPKPTTFQHYLTQSSPELMNTGKVDRNGNPKTELKLNHYATAPANTALRGHKLYWRQASVSKDSIEANRDEIQDKETQYTGIKPVKAEVTFKGRIRFENLSDEELGALLWVLRLPEGHVHALGMGKPLGMGSVRITPTLVVSDRAQRYAALFAGDGWQLAEAVTMPDKFLQAFESYVLGKLTAGDKGSAVTLAEVDRIRQLLCLLKQDAVGGKQASYMTIEPNEYKTRPVLPTPEGVLGLAPKVTPTAPPPNVTPTREAGRPNSQRPAAPPPPSAVIPPPAPASTPKPKSLAPAIGERLMGIVEDIDVKGDVFFAPDKYSGWLAQVAQANLMSKTYILGNQISAEVIALSAPGAEKIAQCRITPKKPKL